MKLVGQRESFCDCLTISCPCHMNIGCCQEAEAEAQARAMAKAKAETEMEAKAEEEAYR